MLTRRVVIIEDDPGLRSLLRALLEESKGWTVAFASSTDALDDDDIARADVALVDLDVPSLEVVPAIERLRAARPGLAVVAITVQRARARAATRAGATAVVGQPFTIPELLNALQGAAGTIDIRSARRKTARV